MENFDKAAIDAKVRAAYPLTGRYHNKFHLEMPFGLINDPNGLVRADGTTHIFFQWNPYGCEHKNKCWAHTTTRDYVHYTIPELALWPSDAHDKDGCYSGCGFAEQTADGKTQVRVLYTCNAKNDGVRTPAQRLGTLMPDGHIEKGEIVIPTNAPGYTGHFRDPYLFYRHGRRYLVLGAQRENETGTALLYREQDGKWEGPLEIATQLPDFGYMWECPNLLKFGDRDVLLFCPQGIEAEEYRYQNRFQSGYLVGHLSLMGGQMIHGHFHELDKGFDFYAPQVFGDTGRQILIGWAGMPDEMADYPTAEDGFLHSLTMPRVLTLRQGKLFQNPIRELKALRIEEKSQDIDAQNAAEVRAELSDAAEVLLDITLGEAQSVTLTLAYALEKLVFHYSRSTQTLLIDRRGMTKGGQGTRKFRLFADDRLSLRLFVDRTLIEAFFQHGEEAATVAVFPQKNVNPELILTSDAPLESVTGRAWALDSFQFHA